MCLIPAPRPAFFGEEFSASGRTAVPLTNHNKNTVIISRIMVIEIVGLRLYIEVWPKGADGFAGGTGWQNYMVFDRKRKKREKWKFRKFKRPGR